MPSYGGGPDMWTCKKDVLRELKHAGSIREYVKQFTSLMLDIRDIDSQDVRRHQSSSPKRNRNSRLSCPKAIGGDKRSGKDYRPYQSNTENTWRMPNNRSPPKRPLSCFICEGPHLAREYLNKVDFHAFQASLIPDSDDKLNQAEEAKVVRLRLRWEKDSRRMKVVNFVALPIVGLVKQMMIKLGGWKGPIDFVVVKMHDFDVVLGMEFLLEHQVIPMLSAKCMQLDENPIQEEPPSTTILLWALEKIGETVPKGIMCVAKKCHGAKASAKNAYRIAPPELAELRKPSKKLFITGSSRHIQAPYRVSILSLKKKDKNPQRCIKRRIMNKLTANRKYPFPILPNLFDRSRGVKYFPNLTDAKGGKCCSVRSQINVLGHVVEFHQIEFLKEEDIQWGNNPQIHRVEKEWEQMVDIARVCLKEASRPMEERVDQKRCPLELEWMTKLPINGRRFAREIHKFLVKWKNPLVEVTSEEHVEDLEAWKQKIEKLQLRRLTGMLTI
ncbi:uncharacterized protein E6C27_scaffold63G00300 [Cucumis melo var. makuwa]|uniref:Reverse transcriptase n=1 Tax=Cucumis melo var. makuwa TaxID=1194695 RepID=A0A5A7TYT5_CUCMM|nr:uncharacterized protein E6C27_scaffold63G00300 [Cucumis melo var. makuwa]